MVQFMEGDPPPRNAGVAPRPAPRRARSDEQKSQDIERALEAVGGVTDLSMRRSQQESVRRQQALAMRMAGASLEQIGERLGIAPNTASKLINTTLESVITHDVEQQRALENARLDRAQAAIWNDVVTGDLKALRSFLAISAHRAKINGLFAPTKIELAMSIRQEMESALTNLETMISQGLTVISGEVLHDAVDEAVDEAIGGSSRDGGLVVRNGYLALDDGLVEYDESDEW